MLTPPVETIRIGSQGREQLIKLKRQTKIENWNILCRWAYCVSLAEETKPIAVLENFENSVEMTWKVFSADLSDYFVAATKIRADSDGFDDTPEGMAECFKAHLSLSLIHI